MTRTKRKAVINYMSHEKSSVRYIILSYVPYYNFTVTNYFQAETLQSAAMYVACGIDPNRSKIFVQSHVRAHAEMTW